MILKFRTSVKLANCKCLGGEQEGESNEQSFLTIDKE